MGLFDDIKGFISNAGHKVSDFVSDVYDNVSDFAYGARDVIEDTVIEPARKTYDQVFETYSDPDRDVSRLEVFGRNMASGTVSGLSGITDFIQSQQRLNQRTATERNYEMILNLQEGLLRRKNITQDERVGIARNMIRDMERLSDDKFGLRALEDDGVYKTVGVVGEYFDNLAQTHRAGIEEDFPIMSQYAQGIGQMAPFIGLAVLTRGKGGATQLASFALNKGDAVNDFRESLAKEKGITVDQLSDEDVLKADELSTWYGLAASSIDSIIPNRIASKIFGDTAGTAVKQTFLKEVIMKLPREVLMTSIIEGGTEGAQRLMQNAIAKYSGVDPTRSIWTGVIQEGLLGAAVGGTFAPLSVIGEVANERVQKQTVDSRPIFLNESVEQQVTGIEAYMKDGITVRDEQGYFKQAMIDGRLSDIQQKFDRENFPFGKDGEFMRNMDLSRKYKTLDEFSSAVYGTYDKMYSEYYANNPDAVPIITKTTPIVPDEEKDQMRLEKIADKSAAQTTLSTSIPEDSEYTSDFDDARFSDPAITSAANMIAAQLATDADQITEQELPVTENTEQKVIDDVLQNETSNRNLSTTDESMFVSAQNEPVEYEITFDRTKNGHDVVNKYEYINGERYLSDTVELKAAQQQYGTTDRRVIAQQFSGIVDPIVSDMQKPKFQDAAGDTKQYSRAQAYATRISQYQKLLNKTRGTLQRRIIKDKISALEVQRRQAMNVEFTDTFVTDEEIKQMIENIPFLKNVTIVELQNMIAMNPGFAYGSYAQAIIQFVKNPHETTLPHEAFHAFADLVLTKSEKDQMMALIRKEHKEITDNTQAEEKAAQLFAEYFVTQMKPKTPLQRVFSRLKQLMLEFVGVVPEIEKVFNKVVSPFTTVRIGYAQKMSDMLPGIRQKMQGNVLVESSKMFTDKFFARSEFRKQDLIDKLNKKTISVPEPIRFLMLSVITSGEFENQKTVNMNDFKQSVSERTMKITLIDSDKYNSTGYGSVNQPDGKRTVINTNFGHGRQGHFSNEFDSFTKKEDIEIREVAAGTYSVEGQEQTVDKDVYAVIRKDVTTKKQLEDVGVFALFDTGQEAQAYIDAFEERVTHNPGLFAHFGWSYDEETKTFFLDEVQSDAMKGKFLKDYYRANKRFADAEKQDIKRSFDSVSGNTEKQISFIKKERDSLIKTAPITKALFDSVREKYKGENGASFNSGMQTDAWEAFIRNGHELIGEMHNIADAIDVASVNGILIIFDVLDKMLDNVEQHVDNEIALLEKDLKDSQERYQEKLSEVDAKYGEEGWYFRNINADIIKRYNYIIDAANDYMNNAGKSSMEFLNKASFLNSIYDRLTGEEVIKFLDYVIADNSDLFEKFISDTGAADQRTEPFAKKTFLETLPIKKLESYITYFEDQIIKLSNTKLTAAQRKEIELSEQFLSYRSDHYKLTVKEAIQKAAQMGAERIAFPSNYTLAQFEGWGMTQDNTIDEGDYGQYTRDEISVGEEVEEYGMSGFVTDLGEDTYTVLIGDDIQRFYVADAESEAIDRIYDDPSSLSSITNGTNGDEDIQTIVYDLATGNEDIMKKFKEGIEKGTDVNEALRTYIEDQNVDDLFEDELFSDINDDAKEQVRELAEENIDIEQYMSEFWGDARVEGQYIYASSSEMQEVDPYYRIDADEITEENFNYEEHLRDDGHQAITKAYDTFIRPYFIKNRGGAEFEMINDFGYYVAPIKPNDVADVILFQSTQEVDGGEVYQHETQQPLGRKITNALADSEGGAVVYEQIKNVIAGGKYPDRVPQELRRRQLFTRMKGYIEKDDMPLETNTREIRLYDIIHNWMREESGYEPVDFVQQDVNETGTIIRTAEVPAYAKGPVAQKQNTQLYDDILVLAYDELSQIRPGETLTQEEIETYVQKIANDIAVDTKSVITKREKQLLDSTIRELTINLNAVEKEKNAIANLYLQQIRFINETYTPDTFAPKAYKAHWRKFKRKATDEELAEMVDLAIEEAAIEYSVEDALRYIELKNAQNILTRLINVYKDDMKTGSSRAVRYMEMLKTKTNLINIISDIKKFTRELPQIKSIKSELDIAKALQDKDYRKAFASLSKEDRFAYDLSTPDFVKRLKDTYVVETAGGDTQFANGSKVDDIEKAGGKIKYSLASRAEKENYETVDAYLAVITENQKSIDKIKAEYNKAYNEALMTEVYVDTLRKLNNTENRMNVIASSYPNRDKFLLAMRALERQAGRDISAQNARHNLSLQRKQLQAKIARYIREGKEDVANLKAEYKRISDAEYAEHIHRASVIAWYEKTYKFIGKGTIEKMVSRYATNAGMKTNLFTMPRSRFNSILSNIVDPLIEDAMIKFAAAKEVNDLIETRQIVNADNLQRALKLKAKLNTFGKTFRDVTKNQLDNVTLNDIAEYHDILDTLTPGSEVLPERILEKALRFGHRPGYDFNVFITEKDFIQAVALARGITEQEAYNELQMRKRRGYSKLNDLQGISHLSDADVYTDFITNVMVDMMMASDYEYETFRKKYQKMYKAAVSSRRKSLLHSAMSEVSRYMFGSDEMDTDMIIHNFLGAYDRTKTPEENDAMTYTENKAIADALLAQMTQQEQDLALWLKQEALFEAGQFLNVYENVKLKDNYITYQSKRLKGFLRTKGIFRGMLAYISQNDTTEGNVFLEISEDIARNKRISTRHMFNNAKKRYSIDEGSTDLSSIVLPYMKDFTRHKQFVVNLPRIASMVDILGMDATPEAAKSIEGLFKNRLDQLRGSYKYVLTPGSKPTRFFRALNSFLNWTYLTGRFFYQTIAPLSDVLAILRDVTATEYLGTIPVLSKALFYSSSMVVKRFFNVFGEDLEYTKLQNVERLTDEAIQLVGRTFFDEMFALDKTMWGKFKATGLIGYGLFFPELNRFHLYTMLSKKEIETGEFEPGNLAKYAKRMARGRYQHGPLSTSPLGGTVEGQIATKYLTWAMPEAMNQVNFMRDILKKSSDLVTQEEQYSSVTTRKLFQNGIFLALGIIQVVFIYEMVKYLVEAAVLPENPDDDDEKQKKIRRALSESSSPAGVLSIASRVQASVAWGFRVVTERDEEVNELEFVDKTDTGPFKSFTDMFSAVGNSFPAIDFMVDNIIKTGMLYYDAIPYGQTSVEAKEAFDKANYNLFNKVLPITSSAAVRSNIKDSPDGRFHITSSWGIDVPFLSAKERERDLSEKLFGHRFGMDNNQKEAYKIYQSIDKLSTPERFKVANAFINDGVKEHNELGKQLRVMIANENFTTEQKNILSGISRTYYRGEGTMRMTDGFKGYAVKKYLDGIKDPAERVEFITNFADNYVRNEIVGPDVLKSYAYLANQKVTFDEQEEGFYTISSFDEKRAKVIVDYIESKGASDTEAYKMTLTYAVAGMYDEATAQAMLRFSKERGWSP